MRYLLHHLLEAAAVERPDAVAVVDGDRSVAYRELDVASNRLANLLVATGVERGDRVGLYMDKSLEAVVGVYGIMKAGGVYVPLDPDAPLTRLNYIARDCGLRVLLTGEEKRPSWPLVLEDASVERLIVMNGDDVEESEAAIPVAGRRTLGAHGTNRPASQCIDQDLAYILYTSGSTGDPKGVMLTHRAALAFIEWAAAEFGVGPSDRLSSHAPLHFDLSVFDLYAAARGGATVVLVPPKTSMFPPQVVRFIRENAITVWYSVPSVLSMITLRGGLKEGDLRSLRTVLFAGEVFPIKYLTQLMRLLPHARFANLYGPTETNVCTWYDVSAAEAEPTDDVPIGKAIANDDVFALTDDGSVARVGEQGQLYVRGATVMKGYWNDAERTDEALVPNPVANGLEDRVYRTGDVVEVLPTGDFQYLGRKDLQVKTRGYRVELGEIESILYSHRSVVECAVVAVPDELVTNRLIAFVVVRDDSSESDLVQFCFDRLPRYMVPEALNLCAELPKTSTGKLDRRSLYSKLAAHTK